MYSPSRYTVLSARKSSMTSAAKAGDCTTESGLVSLAQDSCASITRRLAAVVVNRREAAFDELRETRNGIAIGASPDSWSTVKARAFRTRAPGFPFDWSTT